LNAPIIEMIGSTGVGGLLALVVFWFYRKDALAAAERLAALDAQYAALLDRVLTVLGEPPRK
jgi:hypothetical protein